MYQQSGMRAKETGVTGKVVNVATNPVVTEMVKRIAERCHPQKIIIFGSHARGEARSDSDFDLLIIAPSDEPRWHRTIPIYGLFNVIKLAKRFVGHGEAFVLGGFVPWILAAWADRFDRAEHDLPQARQDIRNRRAAEQQHDRILHFG